mmetsp:Transcript_15743/g.18961  ORF Transcript_15743/g.18961 Transcript_15743/m.18961 type:complete len:290 (+) Transcript_15743:237-1106(+)
MLYFWEVLNRGLAQVWRGVDPPPRVEFSALGGPDPTPRVGVSVLGGPGPPPRDHNVMSVAPPHRSKSRKPLSDFNTLSTIKFSIHYLKLLQTITGEIVMLCLHNPYDNFDDVEHDLCQHGHNDNLLSLITGTVHIETCDIILQSFLQYRQTRMTHGHFMLSKLHHVVNRLICLGRDGRPGLEVHDDNEHCAHAMKNVRQYPEVGVSQLVQRSSGEMQVCVAMHNEQLYHGEEKKVRIDGGPIAARLANTTLCILTQLHHPIQQILELLICHLLVADHFLELLVCQIALL